MTPPASYLNAQLQRLYYFSPTIDDLEPLLAAPAEALDVEHKCWLDLRGNEEHKAALAKAAIALANEGGGAIVIGYREDGPNFISEPRPSPIASYDGDLINGIIRRFASPSFQCTLTLLPDRRTGHEHAVVQIPGGFGVPSDVEERHRGQYDPTAPLLYPQAGAGERATAERSRVGSLTG